MQLRRTLFALLLLAAVPAARATVLPYGTHPIGGTYQGVLPCADCAGIWTEIVLADPGSNAGQGSGTFVMSQRFTGGKNGRETLKSEGTWSTLVSDGRDGQTGTLELVPTHSDGTAGTPMFFYVQSGRTLQMLDAQKQSLPLRPNHTLDRVIPPPVEAFGPLTETDNGKTVEVKVGDVIDIRLVSTSDSGLPIPHSELSAPDSAAELVSKSKTGEQGNFYHDWRLRMIRPGHQAISFAVMRPSATGPQGSLTTIYLDVVP